MEAREFENQLRTAIKNLDFVENIDVSVEKSVLDGRINLFKFFVIFKMIECFFDVEIDINSEMSRLSFYY